MPSMREQRADLLNEARKIAEKAIAEDRDLGLEEKGRIDALIKSVDDLDIDIAKAEASKARIDAIARIREDHPFTIGTDADVFTHEQKSGIVRAARTKTAYAADVDHVRFKAAIGSGTLLPTSGATVSGYPIGTGAVPLRNLLSLVQAEGPTVRYYRIGQATAAVVAEGAAKPDSGVAVTSHDAALVKVASTFKITDELREDASFLIDAITAEVVNGTIRKENDEIVTALTGASGALTASGAVADALDVIATAIGTQEAVNGITPAALVLNPTDLANLRKTKASTGGEYHIDPLTSGPTSVHGVPLVATAAASANTMILISRGAGVMYWRGPVRVESGMDLDDFVRNTITFRVEERVLPAVIRPRAGDDPHARPVSHN